MLTKSIDLTPSLDKLDSEARQLLGDVQANILKAHARKYAVYLVVQFEASAADCRKGLATVLKTYVTSALAQAEISEAFKQEKKAGVHSAPVGMFLLSGPGYRHLRMEEFAPNSDKDYLLGGMKFHSGVSYSLWTPDLKTWEAPYRDYRVDAILILADDDLKRLAANAQAAKKQLSAFATVLAEEQGHKMLYENQPGHPLDHFGFRDGISKPKDPGVVLVEEPPLDQKSSGGKTYGSFGLFLKMEQNVLEFHRQAAGMAGEMNHLGVAVTAEQAEALAFGRHQDGTPLVHKPVGASSPAVSGERPDLDDFDYSTPAAGAVCPAHAHIRKMNPRDEQTYVIARRGMSYGADRADLADPKSRHLAPSSGVGTLFLSYQDSLRGAAGLLSRARFGAMDAVAGNSAQWIPDHLSPCPEGMSEQLWTIGGKNFRYRMADFVTTRGGEYFFAPSMSFLGKIGEP